MRRMLLAAFLFLSLGCIPAHATWTAPVAGDTCYGINAVGATNTVNCILTNAPAAGSTVVLVHTISSGLTLTGISDGTTSYTTNCSTMYDATAGTDCAGYLIPAITGGQSITATFTGGNCTSCSITVDIFHYTGVAPTLDSSTAGNGTGTVTTPTATVSGTDLIWGSCTDQNDCNGVTGSWTAETSNGSTDFGEAAEYQLNVSSSTAVGFAGTAANFYDSMGIAFKQGGATPRNMPAVIF